MIFQTDRLIARHWRSDDFPAVDRFFSDPVAAHFIQVRKPEESWRMLAGYVGHQELRGYSYLALERKLDSAFVGAMGIWDSDPWPEAELGYWIIPKMQRQGYAVEAGQAWLNYAFGELGMTTLVSFIDPENEPSKKVAERLGGVPEGMVELVHFGTHQVYRYSPDLS